METAAVAELKKCTNMRSKIRTEAAQQGDAAADWGGVEIFIRSEDMPHLRTFLNRFLNGCVASMCGGRHKASHPAYNII